MPICDVYIFEKSKMKNTPQMLMNLGREQEHIYRSRVRPNSFQRKQRAPRSKERCVSRLSRHFKSHNVMKCSVPKRKLKQQRTGKQPVGHILFYERPSVITRKAERAVLFTALSRTVRGLFSSKFNGFVSETGLNSAVSKRNRRWRVLLFAESTKGKNKSLSLLK